MFELYGYQKPPLKAVRKALKIKKRALMVMASGLGKTVIAAFFAKDQVQNGRMLFLCHENEILAQALSIFRQVLGETVSLGVFTGQKKDYEDVDILFASFQTFREWKQAFHEDEFTTIIVDESHHGQAPTFKDVIEYFKPQKLFGMTATPDRMDEKDIREIFGDEVVNLTLEEGIAKGWLTPVEYHVMNDDLNTKALKQILKDVLEKGQRISIKQLNEIIFIKARDEEIARIIQSYNRKTIIFCERIDHAEEFVAFLPGAECFHSQKSARYNDQVLKAFRDGTLQYILAVDKFNEGIDIPDAEMVVFLRCTDSRTVFLQQLGRGLRKVEGKDKIVVLDFVANCHRLIAVRDMVGRVKSMANGQVLTDEVLKVTGKAFDFMFTDDQIDILEVIASINTPFYETWQEASQAAQMLGFTIIVEYLEGYKQDPRLPSDPRQHYKDLSSWSVFFGKYKYETWQEASQAVQRFGISSIRQYSKDYKKDPRLCSNPQASYKDFPRTRNGRFDWDVFFGREKKLKKYKTWQEASRAAQQLGIRNTSQYGKEYKKDPRLPAEPHRYYRDLPRKANGRFDWDVFFGQLGQCKTWQEASQAVQRMGIINLRQYEKEYKRDSRLPSSPSKYFKDFPRKTNGRPDWYMFFGRSYKYETWQKASQVAQRLGIRNTSQYKKEYKKDPLLPADPHKYYKDFPRKASGRFDWDVFWGKESKPEKYKTWQEASQAAQRLGIITVNEYLRRYKKDLQLSQEPNKCYKDFPRKANGYADWDVFFGRESKPEKYKTWQEASQAAQRLEINSTGQYRKEYQKDPRLPAEPERYYKDFPRKTNGRFGWDVFFGREKKPKKYPTWQEASQSAQCLSIVSTKQYREGYKRNDQLPSLPHEFYEDFPRKPNGRPDWDLFFGRKK